MLSGGRPPREAQVHRETALALLKVLAARLSPASIPLPTASHLGGGGTACNCTGPDFDCGDFSSYASAQAGYDSCMAAGYGDVFRLDGSDKDGKACETLP